MAAKGKRGATRGRRTRRQQSSPLVWAIGGLLVGLLVALLVWINVKTPAPQPASATPDIVVEQSKPAAEPAPLIIPKPEKSPYGFYQELKEQRVIVPPDETATKDAGAGPLLLPSKPAATGGGQAYILQVGSFRQFRQADQMKARLALMGIKARIEKVRVSDGVWHRVRLGPFDSMEKANQLRSRLLAQKIKSMLVKVGQ